jgi:hypothetical protein
MSHTTLDLATRVAAGGWRLYSAANPAAPPVLSVLSWYPWGSIDGDNALVDAEECSDVVVTILPKII